MAMVKYEHLPGLPVPIDSMVKGESLYLQASCFVGLPDATMRLVSILIPFSYNMEIFIFLVI